MPPGCSQSSSSLKTSIWRAGSSPSLSEAATERPTLTRSEFGGQSCALDTEQTTTGACVSSTVMVTVATLDRKSTRLNSSHANISYAVFCLKKKKISTTT